MTEKTVVAERGNGGNSQGHASGGFAGGEDKEQISGNIYRDRMGESVRETGKIHVDR